MKRVHARRQVESEKSMISFRKICVLDVQSIQLERSSKLEKVKERTHNTMYTEREAERSKKTTI